MHPIWNCGHSKWQHGTGDDACDQYLPEIVKRQQRPDVCPIVADWQDECERRARYESSRQALSEMSGVAWAYLGEPQGPGRSMAFSALSSAPSSARRAYEQAYEHSQRQRMRNVLLDIAAAGANLTRK